MTPGHLFVNPSNVIKLLLQLLASKEGFLSLRLDFKQQDWDWLLFLTMLVDITIRHRRES